MAGAKMTKKIKKIWEDVTGVSPIIAVILMVAITVVLAATIYVWVSGFGGGGEQQQSVALQQQAHNTTGVVYMVTGAEGFLWSDCAILVDGEYAYFSAYPGGYNASANLTGAATAGELITVYDLNHATGYAVGEDVLIIDKDSNKIVYDTQITTA
jgi:flagellin-like protein